MFFQHYTIVNTACPQISVSETLGINNNKKSGTNQLVAPLTEYKIIIVRLP